MPAAGKSMLWRGTQGNGERMHEAKLSGNQNETKNEQRNEAKQQMKWSKCTKWNEFKATCNDSKQSHASVQRHEEAKGRRH